MSANHPNINPNVDIDAPSTVEQSIPNYTSDRWNIFIAIIILFGLLFTVAVVSWCFFVFRGAIQGESASAISHQSFGISEPTNIRRLVLCHYCSNYCKRGVPCPHCGVYGVGMAACHKCLLFGKKGNACENCGIIIKTPTFCKQHCGVFGLNSSLIARIVGCFHHDVDRNVSMFPVEPINRRVAVIGAGASGLVALKSFLEVGLRAECYEKTNLVGGVWQFKETKCGSVPSVMRSTIANTSKEMTAFSDYPPPEEFPEFMPRECLAMYLEMYSESNRLQTHLHLSHEVVLVRKTRDHAVTGQWLITLRHKGDVWDEVFDAVAICTGLYTYPHIPQMPGMADYEGRILHSHDYKDHRGFEGKKVLVVGMGNSSADIAVELSKYSNTVYVSVRRKTKIYPRLCENGIPLDFKNTRWHHQLFQMLPRNIFNTLQSFAVRNQMDVSLGATQYDDDCHPPGILNDMIIECVQRGEVVVKGPVLHFTRHGVRFTEEPHTEFEVDIVIMATGFDPLYPFLCDMQFIDGFTIRLYKNVFPVACDHACLAVVGLFRVVGAAFPVSEMQARWVARVFRGECRLPSKSAMLADIQKQHDQAPHVRSFVRYQSLIINFLPYMDELANFIEAKPNLWYLAMTDPRLFKACYWGPLVSYQYRLQGRHSWAGARCAIMNVNKRLQSMRNPAGSDNGTLCSGRRNLHNGFSRSKLPTWLALVLTTAAVVYVYNYVYTG
uniref:Flavin-containing monooxygenase n=1 Tax=Strigamia maritima TaxID=126957 RepID=T1J018_STRMM